MGLWSSKSDDGLSLERVPVLSVDTIRGPAEVPALVVSCTQWLERHGLGDRNLYGEFAPREAVLRYRSALRKGTEVDAAPGESAATMTSVLRHFLLHIPTGVFTQELASQFTMYRRSMAGDRFVLMRGLLDRLPARHRDLVLHLAHHLHVVAGRLGEAMFDKAAQYLVPARSDALAFMARHFDDLFDTRLFGVPLRDSSKRSIISFNPGLLTRIAAQRMRRHMGTGAPRRAGEPECAAGAGGHDAGEDSGGPEVDEADSKGAGAGASAAAAAAAGSGLLCVPARDLVPRPLLAALEWVNAHALEEEGLYRVPGSKTTVEGLRTSFDRGEVVVFEPPPSTMCAETACSLIKEFMRSLPESEFTDQGAQAVGRVSDADPAARVAALRSIVGSLPPVNRAVLRLYFGHLARVHAHSAVNKMTANNLAIAIRPKAAGWQFCVEHAEAIFGPDAGADAVEELDEDTLVFLLGKDEASALQHAVLRPKGPRSRAPGEALAADARHRSFFRRELQRRAQPAAKSPHGLDAAGAGAAAEAAAAAAAATDDAHPRPTEPAHRDAAPRYSARTCPPGLLAAAIAEHGGAFGTAAEPLSTRSQQVGHSDGLRDVADGSEQQAPAHRLTNHRVSRYMLAAAAELGSHAGSHRAMRLTEREVEEAIEKLHE